MTRRVLFFIIFLCFSRPAIASEFTIKKELEFIVTNDLKLSVNEKVSLTNNFSQIYPTQYSYTITSAKPLNITAHDSEGNILEKSTPQANSTVILLKFNRPNIGKNQVTEFNISYQLNHQITKRGQNYDLFLPSSTAQTTLTKATLQAPTWLGPLVNYQPSPARPSATTQLYNLNQLLFAEPQRLLFGNQQIFEFDLIYQLDNTHPEPQLFQIPLPPTTDRQIVIFKSITPQPKNITIDPDGNYLAHYELPPNSNLDISALGQIKLFPINTQKGTSLASHLQSQTVWPVNDPNIEAIASALNSPKDIYKYVINTLSYNYNFGSSPGRVGALAALQNPQLSLCTEFTDLFITLARSKGIASREIEGYVLTNNPRLRPANPNTDFLHAWPQYFNPNSKSWIEIDPTWAKTTNGLDYFNSLDLNHIILVIHGQDSQNPPAPGFYKRTNNLTTVNIKLADDELIISRVSPQLNLAQNNSASKLIITNPNPFTLHNLSITQSNWNKTVATLPPFSHTEIDFQLPTFPQSLFPHNRYLKFQLSENNQTFSQSIKNPLHFTHLVITLTSAVIILLISAIIIARRYD
ncbi:MAG: transglutaminase domain-containing protein [Candidatus Shapirobacteria bacterium]